MRKDIVEKIYLEDKSRFADLINAFYFGGREVIRPEDVNEMTGEVRSLGKHDGNIKTSYKSRDILQKVACGMRFIVVGVEEQSEVHYAMPVRVMEYDTAEYSRQLRKIGKEHREKKDLQGAEYLSRFSKNDRLIPTMTLVLYFGERWDGARRLHDLLDFSGYLPEVKTAVADYPLHILEVTRYKNLERFRTDLGLVFGFLQNTKDPKRLKSFVAAHQEGFSDLREDAYDVLRVNADIRELRNVDKGFRNQEGGVNMCYALKIMQEEAREEGRKEERQLLQNLLQQMLSEKRYEDLEKASRDSHYYDQLVSRMKC